MVAINRVRELVLEYRREAAQQADPVRRLDMLKVAEDLEKVIVRMTWRAKQVPPDATLH